MTEMLRDRGWIVELRRPKFNTSLQVRWSKRTQGFFAEFLAEQWLFRCSLAG
jgi:hypothetical protein